MQAMILDGVVVESGAFVAAGSFVTPGKRIRSGELWAGRPARRVRAVGEKEQMMIRADRRAMPISRGYLDERSRPTLNPADRPAGQRLGAYSRQRR